MSAVTLHRDPQCRGSIGGRYFAVAAGREWLIEGSPGCWIIGPNLDVMSPEELAAYTEAPDSHPGEVVFTLAAARTWLAEQETAR